MKRLILFFVVPTCLCATDYGIERYYQLSDYVAYEWQRCPALVADGVALAKNHDQEPSYDSSSIFVCQQPRQDAVSNANIGSGLCVVGVAVMQCMDWWIKRNRRIQQFVATYSRWTCDDYQRVFEGPCLGISYTFDTDRSEGYLSMSRPSVLARVAWHLPDEKIFILYHHYQFRGFREYLKTCRGYEQAMLDLAAALECKDKKIRKAIKHMPGCSRTQFTTLIYDMVSDIHRARALSYQQEQEQEVLSARRTIIEHATQECIDLAQIASTWNTLDVDIYRRRLQAYEQIQSGYVIWHEQQYQTSSQVDALILSGHYQPDDYQKLYGNQLQHALHVEQMAILSHAAAITVQHHIPLVDRMRRALVECVDVSHYYTQHGYLAHASVLTDYAWAAINLMSEIGTGVAEGFLEGVGDGIVLVAHRVVRIANTLLHPIDKAVGIGNKLALLCEAGKKVCNRADASCHNPDSAWSWQMVDYALSAIVHCARQQASTLGPRGIAKASVKFVTCQLTRAIVESHGWRAVGKLARYAQLGVSQVVTDTCGG